ncbi:MAG TPA: hypothetical protein VHX42_04065, partial [Candidatus Babeliales bacterium]|nr:hypothetical protein [Candidatus Babeliales bacterium]
MKYFLNILFLIFTGSVLGSEQNNEIYQFTAYVRENQPLVSCDKEYIDSFNETYGTQYKYEDPFLPVYFDAHSAGQMPHFF